MVVNNGQKSFQPASTHSGRYAPFGQAIEAVSGNGRTEAYIDGRKLIKVLKTLLDGIGPNKGKSCVTLSLHANTGDTESNRCAIRIDATHADTGIKGCAVLMQCVRPG